MSRKIPVDLSLPQKIHLAFNVPLIVNSPELRNCRHFVFYYLFLGLDCSYVSFVPMYCLFLCLVLSYVFPFPMFCTGRLFFPFLSFSLSYVWYCPMFCTVPCSVFSFASSFHHKICLLFCCTFSYLLALFKISSLLSFLFGLSHVLYVILP